MTDVNPENFAEFATQDGPGSADEERDSAAEQEHPEQEAHGGSMAPGLVDPTGQRVAGTPEPPD